MNATLVVLGDLGRSPRMQYHALALADTGARVSLVGYNGESVFPAIAQHPRIDVRRFPVGDAPLLKPGGRGAYILRSATRLVRVSAALGVQLLQGPRPDLLLVQVPPALPTLAVAAALSRLRGGRLVIDWHNLASPLVDRRLGAGSVYARLHRWLERSLASRAHAHLCISVALQKALEDWGIKASVAYDRPQAAFTPTPLTSAEEALRAIGIETGPSRPLVVVSPTGWTDEEDFALLLDALDNAETELGRAPGALPLVVLMTGRGPLREWFEQRIVERRYVQLRVMTVWLPGDVYPRVLGACDVGLSVHRSTSGMDLAMKVEDLLGSGLPVLALDHGCVREQIASDGGGWPVRNAAELGQALATLAREGRGGEKLRRLREQTLATPRRRFAEEWDATARPALLP